MDSFAHALPDYVVLGGGNAKLLKELPSGARLEHSGSSRVITSTAALHRLNALQGRQDEAPCLLLRNVERASDLCDQFGECFHGQGLHWLVLSIAARLSPLVVLSFADFVADDSAERGTAYRPERATGGCRAGCAAQPHTDCRALLCGRPRATSGQQAESDRQGRLRNDVCCSLHYLLKGVFKSAQRLCARHLGGWSRTARR